MTMEVITKILTVLAITSINGMVYNSILVQLVVSNLVFGLVEPTHSAKPIKFIKSINSEYISKYSDS